MGNKDEKTKYSPEELNEFEELILSKIELSKKELNILKASLNRSSEAGTSDTSSTAKVLEDGAETIEKESVSQLAARQQKFVNNLENYLILI